MDTLPNSQTFACENASVVNFLSQKTGNFSHTFRNPGILLDGRTGFVDNRGELCQGFSIREYVGKVRSLNIRKCWPFLESLLEEGSRDQLLPPLHRPCYRWWACQHCEGEHEHFGTSFKGHEPENYISKNDQMTERQMTVALGDVDPCISQDLEEQIRKLSRVQISVKDDNTAETDNSIRGVESKDERRDVYCYRQSSLGPPLSRAAALKFGTLKPTCHSAGEGKPAGAHKNAQVDTSVQNAAANVNQNGKPDTASLNRSPARSSIFDVMEREYEICKHEGIREEIEKARSATKVAQEQVPAGSVPDQSDRNSIENLNSQETKSESLRHGISNISNVEVSAVKVCPVCKTFTSSTITAVNAHIDDCLAQASNAEKKQGKMQKHKTRRQKKRSILDICAVAPPAQSHLDHQENSGTRESKDSAVRHCKPKKTVAPIQTVLGNAICDDKPTLDCKRKRETQANSLIQIRKAGNGKDESLEMKRKRRHVGIISCFSKGVKVLKMPSAATHSTKTDHGVKHHLKHSRIKKVSRHSNVEQPPSMQVNPVQKCDLTNNQYQQSGNHMDPTHSASMLPNEDRAKEGIICKNTTQVDKRGMLLGEENTGEHSSILTMENAITDVSYSYGMRDTLPLRSDLSHSHNEKSNILGENECRPHKASDTDGLRLQVEETSKPEDPDLLNFSSSNPVDKMVTSLNPGKAGEPEQLNGIHAKSEQGVMHSLEEDHPLVQTDISDKHAEHVNSGFKFVAQTEGNNGPQDNAKNNLDDVSKSLCIQSFDWEKENSKLLHSLQNRRLIWETRKVTERGHIRNARLDLNKKACAIPRDSKGRFLSSHSIDGGDEGDILYPKWKQMPRRKSTKPPRSLLNTSAMKKETNNKEACLSDNTVDLVKFSIHGKRSDYGCIGLPLDSQGELVTHIPNTERGFNQLYKIPNYTIVNEPLVSQGSKMPREFNFVESTKTCHDATSENQPLQIGSFKCLPQQNYSIQCKQPDYRQEYSASKTSQSNPAKKASEHSSLLDQVRREKMYSGSSHVRTGSSSIGTCDTISMLSMQATVQSEYNGDQSQKAPVLEKIYPEVAITKWKQCTTQPVMRLMGQNFTIGGENESTNALKYPQQCNIKDTKSTMGATMHLPSTMQRMKTYIDCCIACNKNQFDLPWPGGNALCQDCREKANTSINTQHNFREAHSQVMSRIESIARHEYRTLNNNAPKQVEHRLPTNNVLHGRSLKDQICPGQAWTSSVPFSAPIHNMLISPVGYLSNNPCVNERHKMEYKDSHVSNQGCPVEKQTYSQLLNSCLEKHTFQKPECNGWTYNTNLCSTPIHSDVIQSLSCPINGLGPLSSPLPSFTCAPVCSTSFPTAKQSHCQIPSSYTSIADFPTSVMAGKCIYPSINVAESEKLMQKLLKNMSAIRRETRHEKLGVTDVVDAHRKCRDESRKRESVKETEGLLGKWISENLAECVAGPVHKSDSFSTAQDLHKRKKVIHQEICSSNVAAKHLKRREVTENNMLAVRHGDICRRNDSLVEFSMDGGNASNKNLEIESILNASPNKCLEKETGSFIRPNNKFLETEIRTSAIGLHSSNAGLSPKLAEPMKLTGGAKHILKPSSQNGNGKKSLPTHYTLPFAETIGEERDKIWKV